jgi:sterol desaturase/sphingolipid hydroxylase (fatty acid hydroxylase superfamily)
MQPVIRSGRFAAFVRWIKHFGDFITIPLAILLFAAIGGLDRFPLILAGLAAWTLVEYLVHRFAFHHRFPLGRRLHQLHHDHPSDPDAERTSLTTPLVASPFALVVLGCAGMEDGSSIFAGLLAGYLIFIAIHYAVHRLPIEPGSWLYPTKIRHLAHHRFDNCNFGVTTGFWDIVFRTRARSGGAFQRFGNSLSRI